MDKKSISSNIEQVCTYFKKIIISDLNINNTMGQTISWNNYQAGIDKAVCYQREYQKLLDNQQYSILFVDSSFIQLFYKFDDKGDLELARLAYYPHPKKMEESSEDLFDYAENASEPMQNIYLEMIDLLDDDEEIFSNNSHIRFDYDCNVKSHSKAHLQFGGINDFRITTSKIISPFIFLDSISKHFFQDWYEEASQKKTYMAAMNASKKLEFVFDEIDHFYITT
ncbi:DUF2290 domain-containing protein [uncultured Shewanella sp.]|uniref:DUF2290 domain-containing protein n=1 Tax=uncultured Shewanella sp. TaxID=173975 RepID=UPI002633D6CF|nr:DUF2290 domain-containing protein [uncultured Shewanella sp.]